MLPLKSNTLKGKVIPVRQLISLLILMVILSACGMERGIANSDILDYTEANYPLMDVVKSSSNQQDVTRIYKAEGLTIDEVATQLLSNLPSKPNEITEKVEDKQVLVYDKFFVTLTPESDNSKNTLVEVATYGFVRDNYQPSFFNGLMLGYMISNILDVDDWGKRQNSRCLQSPGGCYGGYYQSGKGYKGPIGQPSLRGGTSSVRGGGPGTGK